jgi:hypothetical protein
MIPILLGHDWTKPIGYIECVDGVDLSVVLSEDMRITQEMFFDIFGNCGVRIDEYEIDGDVMIIKRGTIMEFSLNGQRALGSNWTST